MLTIIYFDVKIIVYYKDRDGDSSVGGRFLSEPGAVKAR